MQNAIFSLSENFENTENLGILQAQNFGEVSFENTPLFAISQPLPAISNKIFLKFDLKNPLYSASSDLEILILKRFSNEILTRSTISNAFLSETKNLDFETVKAFLGWGV